MKYHVEPFAELDGPGTGFDTVPEPLATCFAVFKTRPGRDYKTVIAVLPTKQKAERHIQNRGCLNV